MQGGKACRVQGCNKEELAVLQRETERVCRFAGRESLQGCREGGLAGFRVARRESLQGCRERGPCKFARREGLQGFREGGLGGCRVARRENLQGYREEGLASLQGGRACRFAEREGLQVSRSHYIHSREHTARHRFYSGGRMWQSSSHHG